jgi:hypothetical protein
MSNDGDQNFAFGETPVKASLSSAQRATPAELVALARRIWQRVTAANIASEDNAGNDKLLESLQAEFSDFSTSFPIVLRWMVQMKKFNARAFEKYLLKHASAKLDSREAFLELQADYLVLLYREEHKRPDENLVRRYRSSIIEQLLEEDKAFQKMQKQVEEELARQEENVDQDRRTRLYEFLLTHKVAHETVGPGGG